MLFQFIKKKIHNNHDCMTLCFLSGYTKFMGISIKADDNPVAFAKRYVFSS